MNNIELKYATKFVVLVIACLPALTSAQRPPELVKKLQEAAWKTSLLRDFDVTYFNEVHSVGSFSKRVAYIQDRMKRPSELICQSNNTIEPFNAWFELSDAEKTCFSSISGVLLVASQDLITQRPNGPRYSNYRPRYEQEAKRGCSKVNERRDSFEEVVYRDCAEQTMALADSLNRAAEAYERARAAASKKLQESITSTKPNGTSLAPTTPAPTPAPRPSPVPTPVPAPMPAPSAGPPQITARVIGSAIFFSGTSQSSRDYTCTISWTIAYREFGASKSKSLSRTVVVRATFSGDVLQDQTSYSGLQLVSMNYNCS